MGFFMHAVDFFCGAGGITCGLRNAGINVLYGIDIDIGCKETYEQNNPGSFFLNYDINELSFAKLQSETGIERSDDNMLFVGCSPCQYWTQINTQKHKSFLTSNLLSRFQEFVDYFKPGHVLIENVPGILKRSDESGLGVFLEFLRSEGYSYKYDVLDASYYGVPQTRKRFILIASRVNSSIKLPDKEKAKAKICDYIGVENGFEPVPAGYHDESGTQHTVAKLSDKNIRRLEVTPVGGNRLSWANIPELQNPCYVGKDNMFRDVYGRMILGKPAPTITTKFLRISNGRFAHPEENRGLSLREGATLQTFPERYYFHGKDIGSIAKQIGNAVPPELARRIGVELRRNNGEI